MSVFAVVCGYNSIINSSDKVIGEIKDDEQIERRTN